MKEKKELTRFFFKNFTLMLLVIVVCEIGISYLYTYKIMPFLGQTVGGPVFDGVMLQGYGTGEVIFSVFKGFVQGILLFLPMIFFNAASSFLNLGIDGGFSVSLDQIEQADADGMAVLYYVGCFLILLLLLLVLLLPYMVGGIVFSVRMQKELERIALKNQKKRQEYEQKRYRMLSDIAHDLKTPITTVAGYAQALRDDVVKDEEKKKQYLDAICSKSQRVDDLLTLLFEYVKLESEGFSLHKQKVDVTELMRESIALLYAEFEQKGIEMVFDIPDQSIWWKLDRLQFSRALENLLNNDLRHVESGKKVLVRAALDEEQERLTITLADTGSQIPDKVARHIFEPFVMGDESRSSKGGSGLGLSIASRIIQMHGGILVLDRNSTPEYTKAFVITLI
ncbi:MAG: HAMP domain-containing histidine kinase [Clostridiaceae bacterium]|nr:HAMP domain-containing histidine kinase [Clostridiaceae bacterium]